MMIEKENRSTMFSGKENLSCGANSIPRYFIKRKSLNVLHRHVLSSKMTCSVLQSTIGYTKPLLCSIVLRVLSLLRLLELVTSVTLDYCFHLIFGWLAIPMAMFIIPFTEDYLYSTTRDDGFLSKPNKCSKWFETLADSSLQTVCSDSSGDHTARSRWWPCSSKRTVWTCSLLQQWRHYLYISLPLRNDSLSIYNGGFNSIQCAGKGQCKRGRVPLCLVPVGRLLFPCSRLLAVVVLLSWLTISTAAYVDDNGPDNNYGEYSDTLSMYVLPDIPMGEEASEPPFGKQPGYVYSYNGKLPEKVMTEGVIICLLAVTAFISLVVWLAKTNFKESQQRRMRREASLRDKTLILQSEDDIV